MAKTWKRLAALLLAVLMVVTVFVGCGTKDDTTPDNPSVDGGNGDNGDNGDNVDNVDRKGNVGDEELAAITSGTITYRTYTSVTPSNWNELTYEDNNDTQILNYLVSSFYEYDYKFEDGKKFNDDGSINTDGIVPGGFEVKYSAATKLEDVTSSVDAKWGYTDEQKKEGSYAWRITLRDDLKWDDGTPINAHDFVYTMQEQLNPLFQNMRASTYYNNILVKGARDYLYQGQSVWVDNASSGDPVLGIDQLVKGDDGKYTLGGADVHISLKGNLGWTGGTSLTYYVENAPDYFNLTNWEALVALADENGYVEVNDTSIEYLASVISTDAWGETKDNVVCYMETFKVYPEVSFEDVGYYAEDDYTLVVCLDSPIKCLKDDGTFSYEAAYSFQSMPLVKKDLYEQCKQAPAEGATLWTSTYNSSLETSASWGPYKLASFQSGKSYELVKNENWFGYALEDNKNQYLIDKIYCEQVAEVSTQWLKFLGGEIDSIGLDVDHKADYRDSKYTYYAPGSGTFGINLYADLGVLKTSGRNNGILAIDDFRKAISLYFDRDDYNATVYTSHRSCYGLLGPSYYYDVENGGVYRYTQFAKEGLLRVYGFTQNDDGTWTDGTNTYADYEAASEVMNGMNRPLAKELIESAYKELTENADKYGYDPSKPITLKFGTSADNENTRRQYDYMVKFFNDLVADTSLEGKLDIPFDASFAENWATDFKAGAYDIATGTGFSGGAFDPAGFLQCYMDPNAGLMYSVWWDVENEKLTYTMPEGDYAGAGEELTMSLYNWYCCLNGMAESREQEQTYNWGEGFAPSDARLTLLAKLEEITLGKYYSIMTTSQYSATVYGAKFAQISDEYNTFMGFGGDRYLRPVYNDDQWAEFVKENNNDLSTEYKKVD